MCIAHDLPSRDEPGYLGLEGQYVATPSLLASKGLSKFMNKPKPSSESSDDANCDRMMCTLSMKGLMYPEPAVRLKG
jgi:hypothetical protein